MTILYFSPGYTSRKVHDQALQALQGTGATVVEVKARDQVVNYLNTGLVVPPDDTPTRAVKISRGLPSMNQVRIIDATPAPAPVPAVP